ncbi:MAG: hypothetical protein D6772_12865, partial [Bacteroidetes bacterium]
MESPLNTILEGQQKAWDMWTKQSKAILDQLTPTDQSAQEDHILSSWFAQQKKLWEEGLKYADLKKTFEQNPKQLQQWAKMQTKLAQEWLRFYQKNAEQFGIPAIPVQAFNKAWTGDLPRSYEEWLQQANSWIKEQLLARMPSPQDFHFANFTDLYAMIFEQWEVLQQLIANGITNWEGIQAFIKPEAYRQWMSKFMGFKPVEDTAAMLDQVNAHFDQYAEWWAQAQEHAKDWKKPLEQLLAAFEQSEHNPILKIVLDINHTIQQGLDSLYQVAGQQREIQMAKLTKDIQFAYIAFILKSIDL